MAEAIPPFVWERDALVEQYGTRRYLYGRWDRLFGCWMTDRREPPKPFYPPWTLVDASGRLCLGCSNAPLPSNDPDDVSGECFDINAMYTDSMAFSTWCFGEYPVSDMPMPEMAGTAVCLFQCYADLIPFEIRRVVGRFALWQWVLLSMIWHEPTFETFLHTELDATGPGFVTACLVMNGADRLRSVERAELCRRIMFAKREDLVPGVSATCSPRTAVTVIGKLRPDCLNVQTCQDLLGILSDRCKAKIVSHGRALTPGAIRLLARLPGWICTGNLPKLLGDLALCPSVVREFVALAENVERHASGLRMEVQRSLRQARSGDRLMTTIETWQARIRELAGFPAPPFGSAAPLRPLSSAGQMRSEALRMRNCIADYVPEVTAGHVYFYCWDAAEPACIMLRRTAPGQWRLSECLGAGNARLTAPTRASILTAVRAALRATSRCRANSRCEQLTLPLEMPSTSTGMFR